MESDVMCAQTSRKESKDGQKEARLRIEIAPPVYKFSMSGQLEACGAFRRRVPAGDPGLTTTTTTKGRRRSSFLQGSRASDQAAPRTGARRAICHPCRFDRSIDGSSVCWACSRRGASNHHRSRSLSSIADTPLLRSVGAGPRFLPPVAPQKGSGGEDFMGETTEEKRGETRDPATAYTRHLHSCVFGRPTALVLPLRRVAPAGGAGVVGVRHPAAVSSLLLPWH